MKEKTKFNRRLDRILNAVSLQKTDRVPVVLGYAGFAARVTNTPMSEFIKSQKNAIQTMLQAYELIGGGDVPASMFAFGTPDEVYNYCRKLIQEIGPDGFILQSGCDIPTNAKLENVQAMVSAARES